MKKGVTLFFIMVSVSLFLAAYSSGDKNADGEGWTDGLGNAEKVEIISPDGSDVIKYLSGGKDIDNFIDELKLDDWQSANIPSDATKGNTFKMYQEDTIKLGQSDDTKGDLNEVATMTAYKDAPYVEFSLKSYSFSFKIPEDVSEYLNEYK